MLAKSVKTETEEKGGIGYLEVLAIRELLTRPVREAFESGEMTGCHDDHSVTFIQAREVDADTSNHAGAFEGGSSVASLDLTCVDEDVLYADIQSQ